jgi:hypothetical protein
VAVQRPWQERGVSAWVDLVRPDGPWPVVVFGASAAAVPLLGTLVAVWAPAPLDRFDDLYDAVCPGGHRGGDRPRGGVWHFIAVTRRAQARGLRVGRRLVAAALAWVACHDPGAGARTLSPAVGLPELVRATASRLGGASVGPDVALRRASDGAGRPFLPILRLHLGAGAWLERVLIASRRGDADSGGVTLRFAYSLDPVAREARADAYRDWVGDRQRAIAAGRAARVTAVDGLWLVGECRDERVMAAALAGAA